MTLEEKVLALRLLVVRRAQELNCVTAVCGSARDLPRPVLPPAEALPAPRGQRRPAASPPTGSGLVGGAST